MSERPTPAEIANALDVALQALGGTGRTFDRVEWLRDRLRSGAVIVHPDDVPDSFSAPESLFGCTFEDAFEFGCRKMRSHIFGGSHE